MYRHLPKLFDKGYSVTEKHESVFKEGSALYKLLTFGAKNLYEYVKNGGIDNIICVHPFAALLVTEMRKKYDIDVTSSIVATDYTCVPGTNCSEMDKYFIPHENLREEFQNSGIPKEKLYVSGIPVRQCFFGVNTRDNARDILGLPVDKKILLMCCGSMGCGPIKNISSKLRNKIDDNTLIIVICGNNNRLYNRLVKKQSNNFYVVGYTNQMHEYMNACDVFVTKPGGVSTTESAVLGKPMVFINAVGGCEKRNHDFFEELQCVLTVMSNDGIPEAALKALEDVELRKRLSSNIRSVFGGKNAAEYIFSQLVGKDESSLAD